MVYWHWIAIGLALMALELLLPSFFFLWLGVAALALGGVLVVAPDLSLTVQASLFGVLGVVAFYLSRTLMKRKKAQLEKGPQLNKRGASLVGQIVVLETAIENGHGRAKIGDSLWSVEGPEAPTGARVRIIAADGTVLRVEKI